jgi:hypothetical protein
MVRCRICRKDFSTRSGLTRHANTVHRRTYETLHKYYVKNPYRSSNRKDVMRQLVNVVC